MNYEPKSNLVFVFDMAGVLVEWNMDALYGPMFELSDKSLDEFHEQVLTTDILDEISAGKPAADMVREQSATHPDWRDEIESYWSRWDEMVVGSIDGTVSVVEELKERFRPREEDVVVDGHVRSVTRQLDGRHTHEVHAEDGHRSWEWGWLDIDSVVVKGDSKGGVVMVIL